VSSASPETIRREPPEFDILRSVAERRDLAALRIGIILMSFFPKEGFSSCRGGSEFLGRYEILLPSVYCEKVSDQFPDCGKCGPIRIPLISFLLVDIS
jgi:hypothetical protein